MEAVVSERKALHIFLALKMEEATSNRTKQPLKQQDKAKQNETTTKTRQPVDTGHIIEEILPTDFWNKCHSRKLDFTHEALLDFH